MMSSTATSSPVSASTLAYLIRWPVLRLIWLKLTFSVSDVAGYRATGQVTRERRKKPFQFARGAMGYSEYAADDRPRYHRGTRIQGERGGNLPMALTGVGPVGCKRTPSAMGSPASRDLTSGARKCRLVRVLRRLSGTRVGYQPGGSNREKAPGGQPCGHRAVWDETPNVGSVRRRAEQWSPNAHPLQPKQRGPASRRRISMRRKPSIQMPKASQTTAETRTANTSVQPPKSG